MTNDRTGQSNSRGVGWEFVHVCIDDHSRIAFSEIKPDEKADSAVPFLKAAIAYYEGLGVTVTRVMTDNVLRAEGSGAADQSLSVRQHALAA
ncbi:ISBm3, transposase, programmed frameshift [Nitrobacter sp. Nb-311A]|nr:ISBm3, transposase, programmed frameshift [Nitrobacter sp. Nb-311A]